jgi:hypothetical protein
LFAYETLCEALGIDAVRLRRTLEQYRRATLNPHRQAPPQLRLPHLNPRMRRPLRVAETA